MDKLREVWRISARTTNEFLDREEFYIALRLISYAQNGIRAEEDSINYDIPVGLPKFESAPLALTGSSQRLSQTAMQPQKID